MDIGNSTSNRTANVSFENGTKLILNDFGLTTIQSGSKLIVEDGAELILNGGMIQVFDGGEIVIKPGGLLRYEDGVTIELNGNDAQLASGGLIHVGNDATFGFTWQGAESGYLRLLKSPQCCERFSAGTNAMIKLEGKGQEDLIL